MSREISKEELRRPDEFVGFFERKMDQFENQKKQIFWGLIIILAIVGIGFFIQSTRTGETQVAAESYGKLMDKIPSNLTQTADDWKAFLTEVESFLKQYPSSSMSPSAFLFKGKAQYNLKKFEDALISYKMASTKLKSPFVYIAREGEALTQMQLAHWDQAKSIWTELSAKEDNPIRDFHLYNLAMVQEQMGDQAGATQTYQKLVKDFSTSTYAESAKLKTAVPAKK